MNYSSRFQVPRSEFRILTLEPGTRNFLNSERGTWNILNLEPGTRNAELRS